MPISISVCAKVEAQYHHFICKHYVFTFPDCFSRSAWLFGDNATCSCCVLCMKNVHKHRASCRKDLDTTSLTPELWSHIPERFSLKYQKRFTGGLWSEHFQCGEVEETRNQSCLLRKSSVTSVEKAENLKETSAGEFQVTAEQKL